MKNYDVYKKYLLEGMECKMIYTTLKILLVIMKPIKEKAYVKSKLQGSKSKKLYIRGKQNLNMVMHSNLKWNMSICMKVAYV
jgi:hypothetical protein